jgi:hypothetical protein
MKTNNSFFDNAATFLAKIMKQTYISKSELLSLKKMMQKLAESDPSYHTLSNRITTISNRAQGKNEANILTEFYERFQAEVLKHQDNNSTASLPKEVWTTEDYKGIPKGSCIHIEGQSTLEYQGTWSFMGGTRPLSIPKRLCSETSELNTLMHAVSEHLKTRK